MLRERNRLVDGCMEEACDTTLIETEDTHCLRKFHCLSGTLSAGVCNRHAA